MSCDGQHSIPVFGPWADHLKYFLHNSSGSPAGSSHNFPHCQLHKTLLAFLLALARSFYCPHMFLRTASQNKLFASPWTKQNFLWEFWIILNDLFWRTNEIIYVKYQTQDLANHCYVVSAFLNLSLPIWKTVWGIIYSQMYRKCNFFFQISILILNWVKSW